MNLNDRLRAAIARRIEQGDTQARIADEAGYPRAKLSDWLSGRKAQVTLDVADRLADAAGVKIKVV